MDRPGEQQTRWQIPFFTIWTGQAFSLFGSMLVQFALVWWLTITTQSATALAIGTLVAMVPRIILGPFIGALVDRWNRRVVMIVADGTVALAIVALAAIYWAGAMQPWHVYAIMFIRAIAGNFHWTAMQASTSLMVPKQHLSRVAGLNQTLDGAMNIASSPVAALLLAVLPIHGIMAIDVVTALVAILPLFFVCIPQPQTREVVAAGSKPSLWSDVREGLRYVWGWPGLLAVGLLGALLNFLLNPALALAPILVTKHFGGGALELGWLEAAWGIGVVAGGIGLSVWGGFRRRIVTTMTGIIGLALGSLLVGLAPAPAFWLALLGIFVSGFMNPIINGPLFAVMQDVVDPDMQGRVFTLMASVTSAVAPLGMIIAGPVADTLGVSVWFVVGGLACLGVGVGAFFVPAIMHLEDKDRRPARVQEGGPVAVPEPVHVTGE